MLHTEIFGKPFMIFHCPIIIKAHVVYSYNSYRAFDQSFSFCILNNTLIVVSDAARNKTFRLWEGADPSVPRNRTQQSGYRHTFVSFSHRCRQFHQKERWLRQEETFRKTTQTQCPRQKINCESSIKFNQRCPTDPRRLRANCVKEYHLKGDQIGSPLHPRKAESKSEAETGLRGKTNEFREDACHMDTQLGYGKFVSHLGLLQ